MELQEKSSLVSVVDIRSARKALAFPSVEKIVAEVVGIPSSAAAGIQSSEAASASGLRIRLEGTLLSEESGTETSQRHEVE